MERLYAPWRMQYIRQGTLDSDECFLCKKQKETKDIENLILFRCEFNFVLMNLYPYSNGHLMIAPNRHIADYELLTEHEIAETGKLTKILISVLKDKMAAQGFNIGYNLGRTAGAGCDTHLHLHIVPRWNGDTNFMPVLSDTKVISESLVDTYKLLLQAIKVKISD